MRSGITHRWLRGSLFLTVLLVLLVESMFVYNFSRSYYNSVQQTMMRRFSSINGQLKMYTGDTAQKTAANRSVALRRMVEQFADKDKYEFMLLDGYGGVIASSSGTGADGIVVQDDFNKAQDAPDGVGVAIYRTASGGNGHGRVQSGALCSRGRGCHAPCHQPDAGAGAAEERFHHQSDRGGGHSGLYSGLWPVFRAGHRGAVGAGGADRRQHRPGRTGCPPACDR